MIFSSSLASFADDLSPASNSALPLFLPSAPPLLTAVLSSSGSSSGSQKSLLIFLQLPIPPRLCFCLPRRHCCLLWARCLGHPGLVSVAMHFYLRIELRRGLFASRIIALLTYVPSCAMTATCISPMNHIFEYLESSEIFWNLQKKK